MNTPPNMVSDARLREIINSPRPKLAATATEVEAALRELQARRAADATREPAPGVVEALRALCRVLQSHRLPAEHEALGAAVAALAAHDARQPQQQRRQQQQQQQAPPEPGVAEALRALLRGNGIGGEHIRFPYRNSSERCLACDAPVSVDEYDEAHEHERGCPRAVALRALAAHDAAQAQRDPVQAVLAEVAALLAGRESSGEYAGEARYRIDEAVRDLRYVIDREAREKGAAT